MDGVSQQASKCQSISPELQDHPVFHSPFAFTHSALRLGRADWSLSCSKDSGGSVYTRLLERLLFTFAASKGILLDEGRSSRGRGSPAKLRRVERLMIRDDSLAVLIWLGDTPGGGVRGMEG